MKESRFFIQKIDTSKGYQILQNDNSYDEFLIDGMWFKSRKLAEKYIEQNLKDEPVKVLEVWCKI